VCLDLEDVLWCRSRPRTAVASIIVAGVPTHPWGEPREVTAPTVWPAPPLVDERAMYTGDVYCDRIVRSILRALGARA